MSCKKTKMSKYLIYLTSCEDEKPLKIDPVGNDPVENDPVEIDLGRNLK